MAQNENLKAASAVRRDTRSLSRKGSFDLFREEVIHPATPWALEPKSECEFSARVETLEFDNGFFRRVKALPHQATRTARQISASTAEGYLALFMISGELIVSQGGDSAIARHGDLILLDMERPCKMSYPNEFDSHQSLAFFAPKPGFQKYKIVENGPSTPVLPRNELLGPLSSCLSLISNRFFVASGDELHALFDASVSLLPVAVSRLESTSSEGPALRRDALFAEILNYVNRDLGNSDLSPLFVSGKFGITDRYLHKLFAFSGTTFGHYVTGRRLEQVAIDLAASGRQREPLGALAYRWGFNDISSFNKAFKERFGCTPKEFRLRCRS